MKKPFPAISYSEYLKVNELTSLQKLRSHEFNFTAHDEMLFIITHQTYELWFKQIITELDSVLEIFHEKIIDEEKMNTVVLRLKRITEIQKLLIQQVTVLETMTPLDFLDFRDLLYPASGFQSLQNRMIENKLGLPRSQRVQFNSMPYNTFIDESDQARLQETEQSPSLFELVDAWLSRTPFLQAANFDFWDLYRQSVELLFAEDRATVENHPNLEPSAKERSLSEIDASEKTFQSLFDQNRYEEIRKEGVFRFSYRSIHAALLIHLYRDQPVLSLPFQVLSTLQDIDELMTTWRYRHSLMAHRMLGRKIGTGGSAGAAYLKKATDQHRIFGDLFNLATFLIPRSRLPRLPDSIKKTLGFFYSN